LPTAAVELRILGPLEAVAAGEAVPLGGPKQRALLALLLIHANEVVAVDTLMAELWGESPPRSAQAYIQNCVSRLRKALGPERLQRQPPGYVLRADAGTIDARRFEQIVHDARGAPARDRAALLREGLALWRGAALADLAFESFAQTEARRLEELRLAALEDRIEAELELGMHAELVGELEALAGANPARERLRRLQLLALYRAGRQVDALAAYQEARLALDELGLEPSEELRALERMILVHDPSLAAAAPGTPDAEPAPAPARETRRPVCVLLAELDLDPDLDPEAARLEASRCLAEIQAVVARHGGSVERLLGEEVIAVFGFPVAHDDDSFRAVRAALESQAAIAPAELRAAVDRCEVVVGGGQPLALGPITALRRLKELAQAGEIVVGATVQRLVGDAATMDGDRVVGLVEFRRRLPLRLDTPFVGRAAELEQLHFAVREAFTTRSCTHLVVVGEPGVGKSRLATEFATSIAGEARVLTGTCVAYGEGATYMPLREVFDETFGATTLRSGVIDALAGDEQAEKIAELLTGAVAGGASLATSGDTQWAVRRIFEELARERSMLVVLEDLHWAEPTFLDLIEYVAGWSEDAPIVLLSLTRPELLDARPTWGTGAMSLRPLSRDDATTLLEELPEAKLVGAAALADVLDVAEGNPLFLEQLVAAAAGAELRPGRVPHSLDALLASRLDRLVAEERAVLERAAVAGRQFTRAAVEALWEGEDIGSVSRCLMAFARRRLVHRDHVAVNGDDAFRFDHVLIREAAYAAITKRERAHLHERLARWRDERGEVDEIVGYHLEQAALYAAELGEPDMALAAEAGSRLGKAGVRALWSTDTPAAAKLLTRAIHLLPENDERLQLECDLGTARKLSGDLRGAEAVLGDVAERAREQGNRRVELRAEIEAMYPRYHRRALRIDSALEVLDDAVVVFEAAGDHLGLGRAWHQRALFFTGPLARKNEEIEDAARRAGAHYEKVGIGPETLATMLATTISWGATPVAEAIDRCQALLEEVPTPAWRSFILPPLAILEAMASHFDTARGHLEEARHGRRESGDPDSIYTGVANIAGAVEFLAGDLAAAETILSVACAKVRERREDAWLGAHLADLADVAYVQQRINEALEMTTEALLVSPPDHRSVQAAARSVRAKALARLGLFDEAEPLARHAVALLESSDNLSNRAWMHVHLATVLELEGKLTEAGEALTQALQLFEAKGHVLMAERARASLLALSG
jgi:DNA-binding SARP family transcriptional activator/tetratricopeptide (TPR) repeat protein